MAQNHCAGQKPAFPPLTHGEQGLGGGAVPEACLLLRTCPSPFSGGLPFISKLSAKQDGTNFEVPTLIPPVPPSQFSLLNFSLFSSTPQRSTSSDTCQHQCCPFRSLPHPSRYTELRSLHAHQFSSVQFSRSVCLTLCDPMSRSMPGLPVHHQLPEFTQTHVHRVSDAIQPSHPLSSPFPPAPNPSQHQSLLQ